jgi:hypothetical protein
MLDGCERGDLAMCEEQARAVLRGLHTTLGAPLCLASAIAVRCLLVLRAVMSRTGTSTIITSNPGSMEAEEEDVSVESAEVRLLRHALRLSLGPIGVAEFEATLATGRRGGMTRMEPETVRGNGRKRRRTSNSTGGKERNPTASGVRDEDAKSINLPSQFLSGPELQALIQAVTGPSGTEFRGF